MKANWDLYYIFEDTIHREKGTKIQEILNQFKIKDYLEIPIIFDLINYKKIHILKTLHQKNIPFTYEEDDNTNALHIACGASGDLKCVKFLIENDLLTDVFKKSTRYGDTPLTLAICYEHHDIVDYFVKKFNIERIDLRDVFVICDRIRLNQQKFYNVNAKKDQLSYNPDIKTKKALKNDPKNSKPIKIKKLLKINLEEELIPRYTKDKEGNVIEVYCLELFLKKAKRSKSNQTKSAKIGFDQHALYDGGHLLASMFGGDGDMDNLVPMILELNRGNYLRMEKEIKAYLQKNIPVTDFTVKIQYFANTKTPALIDVTYKVGEQNITHHFINDKMFNIYGGLDFGY